MGRSDLIGNGKHHLIPSFQPKGTGIAPEKVQHFRTKHTGQEAGVGAKKRERAVIKPRAAKRAK
jgi:hypothetical protein